MSFIAKLKATPLPPLRNILNVAVQTARQTIPERKDYEQPPGSTQHQQQQQPHPHQPQPSGMEETTEMSSNPFRQAGNWTGNEGEGDGEFKGEYQSTSFNEYDGRYQQTDGFRWVFLLDNPLISLLILLTPFQARQHCLRGQLLRLRG